MQKRQIDKVGRCLNTDDVFCLKTKSYLNFQIF